jgi:hypothetical protein
LEIPFFRRGIVAGNIWQLQNFPKERFLFLLNNRIIKTQPMENIDPTQTGSWKKLNELYDELKDVHMKDLFEKDPERAEKFQYSMGRFLCGLQ